MYSEGISRKIVNTYKKAKYLNYFVLDFLSVSTIFPETSSQFISKSHPFFVSIFICNFIFIQISSRLYRGPVSKVLSNSKTNKIIKLFNIQWHCIFVQSIHIFIFKDQIKKFFNIQQHCIFLQSIHIFILIIKFSY